jgi:hypothetical protein
VIDDKGVAGLDPSPARLIAKLERGPGGEREEPEGGARLSDRGVGIYASPSCKPLSINGSRDWATVAVTAERYGAQMAVPDGARGLCARAASAARWI